MAPVTAIQEGKSCINRYFTHSLINSFDGCLFTSQTRATSAQRKVTAPISCEQLVITFYTCITRVKVTATAEMSCRLLVFCKL